MPLLCKVMTKYKRHPLFRGTLQTSFYI